MNKFIIFFTFTLFIILNPRFSFADESVKREVIIKNIKVNGEVINNYIKELVLFQSDSITFNYGLVAKDGKENPFLFKIILANSIDTSIKVVNATIISYKSLPEGNYKFTIIAFDPRNQWAANPISITLRVNNKEAELIKKVKELENKIKSYSSPKTETLEEPEAEIFNVFSIIIGFFVAFLLYIVYFIFQQNKKTKISKDLEKDQIMIKEPANVITKEQYDAILAENGNLRAEIAALRGQIDALNSRSKDLHKQNKELQEKADKLSKSKSELEELQKQKDDLFAVIIHDIKNPASLIKSLVELLRSYDLTATEQHEIINDIFETTTRIVSLSQEVSRILALEGSSLNLQIEEAQLNEIIQDVYRRNTIASKNKSIEILLDLKEDLPNVSVDVQKIDEVVDNLLSNAIKFSQPGSKVRILSHKSDGNVIVEISDNGLGLSEEDVIMAFQRGARLSAKPTAGEHSSGFGLWIVKKLIEAHDGRVWIKSAMGKGSTFAFSLPYIKNLPKQNDVDSITISKF